MVADSNVDFPAVLRIGGGAVRRPSVVDANNTQSDISTTWSFVKWEYVEKMVL